MYILSRELAYDRPEFQEIAGSCRLGCFACQDHSLFPFYLFKNSNCVFAATFQNRMPKFTKMRRRAWIIDNTVGFSISRSPSHIVFVVQCLSETRNPSCNFVRSIEGTHAGSPKQVQGMRMPSAKRWSASATPQDISWMSITHVTSSRNAKRWMARSCPRWYSPSQKSSNGASRFRAILIARATSSPISS